MEGDALPAEHRRGAVVVAEAGGAPLEREAWREAVVFVEGVEAMVDVVKFYLRNETARAAAGPARGGCLKARRFAAALRGPSGTSCSGRAGSGGRLTLGMRRRRWRVASAKGEPSCNVACIYLVHVRTLAQGHSGDAGEGVGGGNKIGVGAGRAAASPARRPARRSRTAPSARAASWAGSSSGP